jgi:hypothetical protein
MNITLAAGTMVNGPPFIICAHANDIDDAEAQSWTGSAITTTGSYLDTSTTRGAS